MFPFLVRNWAKTWYVKLGCSAAVVVLLFRVCEYLRYHSHLNIFLVFHALLYTSPLARQFEFVLGMATAHIFLKARKINISSTTATALEILALSGVLLNLIFVSALLAPVLKISLEPFFRWLVHSSGAPFYVCLIGVIALEKGIFSKALLNRPLIFLGEISVDSGKSRHLNPVIAGRQFQ